MRNLKHYKTQFKYLPFFKSTYKTNIKPLKTTTGKLNAYTTYDVLNKSFYDTHKSWYNKRLIIIGQNTSEFSFDLKLIDNFTFNDIPTGDFIKIKTQFKKINTIVKTKRSVHFLPKSTFKKFKKYLKKNRAHKNSYKFPRPSRVRVKKSPLFHNHLFTHTKKPITNQNRKNFRKKKTLKTVLNKSIYLINL